MRLSEKFVSAVKIAAQAFGPAAMAAQWLDEIETGRIKERLDRLEDPLAKYGPKAKQLTAILYSLIQAQPQDVPSTHIDWTSELGPFIRELRQFEADGLLSGSHTITDAGFTHGFRLINSSFIIYLAVLHDDPDKIAKLVGNLDDAKSQLIGTVVKQSIDLPLLVIDAFFKKYEEQGHGFKSREIGTC